MFTPRPKPWYFSTGDPDRGTSPARRRRYQDISAEQGIGRQRPVEFHPLRPQLVSTGIMVSISSVPI